MGVGGAQNWKADKKYKANSLVYTNEKLYICMEDHTSGTDFATDLLSGKWKFIGNGVGSNISQTQLLSSPLTTTGADVTATLSDDINNYDYAILTFSPTVSGIRKSEVIKVNDTTNSFICLMEYTTQANDLHYAQVSGVISNDNITIRNRNADVTWASIDLESVVGIKIQELTTDYLASLSMPSDVYETITESASNTYVMSNDGYFSVEATPSTTDITGQIQILSDRHIWAASYVPSKSFSTTGVTICTKAGDTVSVRKSGKATNYTYKLIYTVGSAKALGLID